MKHVAIIGGGITGLSTAYALQKLRTERDIPFTYTLLEASSRLGGKIQTETKDGFIMEGGPDSFITQKPWALDLCRELGLENDLVPCNSPEQSVHILHQGRLLPMPSGLRLTLPTEIGPFLKTRLLSPGGKLRALMEIFIPKRKELSDESLASFIRRRLGREMLERFGAPLMAGIYVSDPERMSMLSTFPTFVGMEKKFGSLTRAMHQQRKATSQPKGRPLFMTPAGGMGKMVEALTQQLRDTLLPAHPVTSITRDGDGYQVHHEKGSIQAEQVVVTTPAWHAAKLLSPLDETLGSGLGGIRFVSTATVSLAYPNAQAGIAQTSDSFGFLVPKEEERSILACTCTSSKFEQRAPNGHTLFRVFLGGAMNEGLLERRDDELVQVARSEIEALLHVTGEPLHTHLTRWPRGNPQYDVGHLDRVTQLEQDCLKLPGLHLAGSSYRGVGIPDCIHSGQQVAEIIVKSF